MQNSQGSLRSRQEGHTQLRPVSREWHGPLFLESCELSQLTFLPPLQICGRPLGRLAAVVARMVIKLTLESDLMPSPRDAEPTVDALS